MIQESRAQVIWRHLHAFVNVTGTKWPTLALAVREYYEGSVPHALRRVEFSINHDVHERMKLDAQTLRRFEHDTKHGTPIDLEEAMINALPDEPRKALQNELAARLGLLAAPIPNCNQADDVQGISRLMKETADALEAIAPMLADGVIDSHDRHLAKNALQQTNEAMAELVSMQARITAILPEQPQKEEPKLREVR